MAGIKNFLFACHLSHMQNASVVVNNNRCDCLTAQPQWRGVAWRSHVTLSDDHCQAESLDAAANNTNRTIVCGGRPQANANAL